MSESKIVVQQTVDASPQQLFTLLSTPARHLELDGSGMLRGLDGDAQLTAVGDQFVMKMYNDAVGDYAMRNTVTAYEQNTTIAWAPQIDPVDGYKDKLGDVKVGGHTFTWELAPAANGGTAVTHTYDWSKVTDPGFLQMLPLLTEEQLKDSVGKAADLAKQ